jgi:hypothetical protein
MPSQAFPEMLCRMRRFVVLTAMIAGLWAVDAIAFHGQYSNALWHQATYQGQSFRYAIDRGLRRLNF